MIPMFGMSFPDSVLPVILLFAAALLFGVVFVATCQKLWFVRWPSLAGCCLWSYLTVTVFVRYQTFFPQIQHSLFSAHEVPTKPVEPTGTSTAHD